MHFNTLQNRAQQKQKLLLQHNTLLIMAEQWLTLFTIQLNPTANLISWRPEDINKLSRQYNGQCI